MMLQLKNNALNICFAWLLGGKKMKHINLPFEDFLKARVDPEYLDKVCEAYHWLVPYVMNLLDIPSNLDRAEIEECLTDNLIKCIKQYDNSEKYFYHYASLRLLGCGTNKLKIMGKELKFVRKDILQNDTIDSLENTTIIDDKKNSSFSLKSKLSDDSFQQIKQLTEYSKPIADNIFKYYLTDKEQEIVCLIAEGKSTAEIAQIVNISKGTVYFRLDKMRSRLGHQLKACKDVAKLADQGLLNFQIADKLHMPNDTVKYLRRMYKCVYLGVEPKSAQKTTSLSV